MWYYKDKLVFLVILFFANVSFAQQFTQFSNYLMSAIGVNSAYTGSKEGVELIASYRNQWSVVEGAPKTYLLAGHSSLKTQKIGIGAVLLNDHIGVSSSTSVSVSSTYKMDLGNFKLNFGLNAGFLNQKENFTNLKTVQQNDDVFDGQKSSAFSPSIGMGLYLYSNKFYAGISTPDMIENNTIFQKKRHYYLLTGKVFDVNSTLKIKPSILAKMTESAPVQLDISATVILKDLVGLGASYRTHAGQVFFAQLFLNQNWTFGYSYDHMSNGLNTIENGSHEISVLYCFARKNVTIYSPRYF